MVFFLCVTWLLAASAATAEKPSGSFGSVAFATKVVDGRPADARFQFPAGTREIFAAFDYSGMAHDARWSWRLSREGAVIDESYERAWKANANGVYIVSLTLSDASGIYDLDLYLDGELARLSSFVIGKSAAPAEHLIQADDFDRYRPTWGVPKRVEGGPGTVEIEAGRAVMTLLGGGVQAWQHSGISLGDAVVEVDATPSSNSDSVGYGVVFRYKDDRDFYAFVVNPKGEFAVLMIDTGELVWKQPWTPEAPGIIRTGAPGNRLRVLADGSLFRFYVNDHFVGGLGQVFAVEGETGILILGPRLIPDQLAGKSGGQVAFSRWRVWPLSDRYGLASDKAPWTRFAFATPGQTAVDEAVGRLGMPYLDYKTDVVEDEIDLRGDPPIVNAGVYTRAKARGVNVSEVRVLAWDLGGGRPVAMFVFRGDRLWYAKYPASPLETTPEQLASRHGQVPRVATLNWKETDMLYTEKVYGYPAQGMAFTQGDNDRIESKFVFPPSPELPLGPP